MKRRIVSMLLIAGLFCSGCSFALMQAPAAEPGDELTVQPSCTRSVAAPVIDTLFAVGSMGDFLAGAVVTAGTGKENVTGPLLMALGGATAALFGVSAGHGYGNAARCQGLRNEYQALEVERQRQADTKTEETADAPRKEADKSEENDTLDIFEAAEACYVEPKVIRHALGHNKLQATRTQGGYRIARSDLEAFCRKYHGQTDTKDSPKTPQGQPQDVDPKTERR